MVRTAIRSAAVLCVIVGTRAWGQAIPSGVSVQRDAAYAAVHGTSLKLDVYSPAPADAARAHHAVILRISPKREAPAGPANDLLARGYTLIYAGYLPDDAAQIKSFDRFPTDLQAAKAAVRWIRGNADARHFDADRIGLWGDEDGATVAALLAVTPDQSDLNGALGEYPSLSSAVRSLCLFGGTTDWRNAELYGDESVNVPGSSAYQLFGGNPKEHPDDARTASAVNYIRPTSPPVLMVTLASDANRAMHLIFAETLRRAGVPSALYEEPAGSGAGMGGRAVDEAKLDRTIVEFFNDTLGRGNTAATMPLNAEIDQLVKAGLYKQARRLIEEQVGKAGPGERTQWLTRIRQIADQQREPALKRLMDVMKSRKGAGGGGAVRDTMWTIREVLTDPERIGEYQVEATLPARMFDARAAAMQQGESLNALVVKKDWANADRQAALLRSLSVPGGQLDADVAKEFLSRYAEVRAHADRAWPTGVRGVPFATAFGQDLYGFWFDLRAGGVLQRFRYIAPGSFVRGSSPDEWGRLPGEPPLVSTEVREGFWLSDSPVTQAMWEGVMGKRENHSHFRGPRLPADSVSYAHAVNFLNKLGVDARLPSDIEWEYACRAGSREPYAGTGRLADMGWFWNEASGNGAMNIRILNELETEQTTTPRSTHEVKQKLPNRWGIYDMQGGVWEWCGNTSAEKPRDMHAVRGGSWISIPQSCRAAREAWFPVEEEAWNIGLRVVIPASAQ